MDASYFGLFTQILFLGGRWASLQGETNVASFGGIVFEASVLPCTDAVAGPSIHSISSSGVIFLTDVTDRQDWTFFITFCSSS